ncbi:MAG: ribose 5-phosphate isomerase B [Rhodospirillaceae bacterium]|jgi:ribose 5-phosphate isomerase B|nr:ribose 5-phosphate isomerase B [Rhodospirillaceae bacterium]MBT3627876.1 ribose 5-phosphate isomerase B [Rhodospirillaceae bacterium]MBT3925786.1 ribose 5-phosphate isomerase B [Rhodospirillaceae bacterium]MBT4426847.1 ribose 5-phosphate isomerase B [Rhodospirillaceae bacterium]MBT5039813.1 ribose 5-phosphate isomerase B [Rhodospirillaceae bacterium]
MSVKAVAIASDHRGIALKAALAVTLRARGLKVLDLGPDSEDAVDYPDFADKLAHEINSGEAERGVLICGSGIGMSIAANRHRQVRAALCHDADAARLTRQHNDANVLTLPGSSISEAEAQACLGAFLDTDFEGGRHARRVAKLA